ncbi:hypothetical protein [Saccharothrix xinjiangensis]|uniref:Uncharacterized protein n=1 Tax=Saccharothrix xinjiangensis TaxID=204798 RepID=A0ABV9XVR4_9PSEU
MKSFRAELLKHATLDEHQLVGVFLDINELHPAVATTCQLRRSAVNKQSLILPVLFHKCPDQHKQRTGTSAGAVHRRSKPSHVVHPHRLLQICSNTAV